MKKRLSKLLATTLLLTIPFNSTVAFGALTTGEATAITPIAVAQAPGSCYYKCNH